MIQALLYDKGTKSFTSGDEALIDKFVDDGKQWLWLDLHNPEQESEKALLIKKFGIHELAVSDAQRNRHPPKFEAFHDHLFIILRGLTAEANDIYAGNIQVSLFLKEHLLITRHSEESVSIDAVWRDCLNGTIDLRKGPSHVATKIARKVVDRYTPILLDLEDQLDEFENQTINAPSDKLLGEMVAISSQLKRVRRTLTYQKDVFSSVLHSDIDWWNLHFRHECNDVYEHFERLSSLSTLYQELINDLINGYLGMSAHRLNQIMKVLTLATVIFLPLTVLAGIYGMNFENIPELKWHYGYFAVLGVMLGLVISSLLLVKKLRWL